jgi:hypothetical protein
MKILRNKTRVVAAILASAMLLGGCASSKQARSVAGEGFIVDYSLLEKGETDEALLRYQNLGANIGSYTKVMLDPALIARPDDATHDQIADLQKLATNYYVYLTEELGKSYRMVRAPQPGTMRIQVAITGAKESNVVSNTVSSVLPIGMGVSIVKDFATGKPVGVGEATAEMKVTDAMTGELLGAAVDRRVGGKNPEGITDSWHDANAALEYWAKRLSYVLCMERSGIECEKP